MTPLRIQRRRAKGWRMPPNTVCVSRPGIFGNPFDFRRSEYCWAALAFGCRGDAKGRREAAVRAFRDWIDPPHGRQTLLFEEQPKMGNGDQEICLGPAVKAGAAPSRDEIAAALRGKNLACWCHLCDRHRDGKPLGEHCADCQPCHIDVLGEIIYR